MFSLSVFQITVHSTASHSLPNIFPFSARLAVPASPSPAVACCVYLSVCWWCVLMTVGMNGLTTGNSNSVTSVYVSKVKFRSEWVRLVSQICPQFVCHQSKINCVCWGRELAEFRLSSIIRPTRYLVQQSSYVSACGLIVPGIIDPKA